MRDIKFRAWVSKENENSVFDSGMYGWEDIKSWAYLWEMVEEGTVILMQYTGRKDENGKDIYEGDIMETYTGWKTMVRWNKKDLCWVGLMVIWKVIGNKWENPKLIKDN